MKAKQKICDMELSLSKSIKMQIGITNILYNLELSNKDQNFLVLCLLLNNNTIPRICKQAVKTKLFKTDQSARNELNKLTKKTDILKLTDDLVKRVVVNDKYNIITSGNIILKYNFFRLEK